MLNSPPSQRAELPLVDSLKERPWKQDTVQHSDCSTKDKWHGSTVRFSKLFRKLTKHGVIRRLPGDEFYLDNSLMSLQDGINVHLGALLLHQHDFCALGWQSIAVSEKQRLKRSKHPFYCAAKKTHQGIEASKMEVCYRMICMTSISLLL